MAQPGGGGGLQLGGGAPKLTGLQLGSTPLQQQQQQQSLQLSMAGRPGQIGSGLSGGLTGLTGLSGTQPVGTVAPGGGGLGFGLGTTPGGLGLKPGTSAASSAAPTGLTGVTGLQPGQSGLSLPKPPGATGNVGTMASSGLQSSGLQLGQMKLPQLGQTGLTSQTGLSQLQTQAVSSAAAPNLGIKPQTALTGLAGMTGGTKPPPPYSAPGTGLSTGPASTAVSGLSGLTSKLATTSTTPGVGLGLPKTTAASTGLTGLTTGTTAATGSTGLAGGGAAPSGKKYTYKELENLVNKWSVELQDQEKVFLQQSNQVNAWDRMLAESGDKVAELNEEVQRVKAEQTRVDSELDLIKTQQEELEELLSTLEKDLDQTPTLGVGVHYADMQRTKTFKMAENIDSELKRMGQDLKEIIDQMNSANTNQEEDSMFQQIVKILNAHTDSLGWIDRETALLRQKVDDVAKVTEYRKREQERSFRLAFTQ